MSEALTGFWILAFTVGLSLAGLKLGPFRIHHTTAAVLGALLTISLHILPIDLALGALEILALPVVTIVSLMIITMIAEQAGIFDLVARSIARRAKGSGRRLFAYLFFTGTLAGSVFTNDAAVLIFTPLVFNLVEQVKDESWTLEQKIPFYFSVLYVANVVGALVISNPINIIVAGIFHISFVEYAAWMLLPAAISVLVSFAGIAVLFFRSIPATYRLPEPAPRPGRPDRLLITCAIVLGLVLLGFFSEPFTGLPVWMISVAGASVLLALRALMGRLEIGPLAKGVGWDVIVFVIGIFLVSRGLKEVGLTRHIGALLAGLSGGNTTALSFATGLVSAICSALMNNHPTADTMSWVIRDLGVSPLQTKVLALSALIGGDLGPKMLPIGSLAALLWFRILRERRVDIPYSLYIRIGVPVTLAAVVLSLAALQAEVFIVSRW